jgi:hypothetical protein
MQNRSISWIAPLAVGAFAMYLLDPDRGARRRALIRDKAVWASRKTRDGAAALGCDLQNRATGLVAEMRGMFDRSAVDDRKLEARVRAELGRVSSHPGAITVFASDGHVTLSGPILAGEHDLVTRAVSSVRGVTHVADVLDVHAEPGSIPALQGEGSVRPGQRWVAGGWSPTARFVAALAGAGAIAYGAKRTGANRDASV